tara:strand:+ start:385 stop:864 length:480 start_codon:yes stop_codon:yes gene_type:complete
LFVWVEHDSNFGAHGSWWQVFLEVDSDGSDVSVSVDDGTPMNSEFGVVDGVLSSEDISDSSSEVESGTSLITAVLDVDDSLALVLRGLSSSESSKETVLVESDWLSFVILLLSVSFSNVIFCLLLLNFRSFCHSSLFVIMIIQYIFMGFKLLNKKTIQN